MVRHSNLAINKRHWTTMTYILSLLNVGSLGAFRLSISEQTLHT
jgi:hypothetical protein